MRHARHLLTVLCCFLSIGILAGWILAGEAPTSETLAPVKAATGMEGLDRTVLPIPEPATPPITVLDVRKAKAPPRFEVKAPKDAPNVLIVLIDDMGFGQPSTFGGPIQMPTADRLAKGGLRYNHFHTTALCSPTRAALLSGRNHHMCNMGSITETATAFPGQTGQRPNSVAPLAEMLRLNGFATAAFGKSHETAAWEVSTSGPTTRWPTRSGFDRFYGFIGGEANQWAPTLYEGLNPIETPKDPNYHFMTDMTNQAIAWTKAVKSLTPDKPFFVYFAPGATQRRTMYRRNGSPGTRASSTRAGTNCARRPWRGRLPWGWSPPAPSWLASPGRSRTGMRWMPMRRSCSPTRWKSSPATVRTPTMRSAAWCRPLTTWGNWTTRSSFTSWATTVPVRRGE